MTYKEECLEKFNKFPESIKDLFNGIEAVENIDKINQEFGVDIDFLIILLAIGELMIYDIDVFARKKFHLNRERSLELSSRINELILDPAIDTILGNEVILDDLFLHLYNKTFIEFEEESQNQQQSPEFYLNILPQVLSSNIFYLLDANTESKKVINDVLIYLLLDEQNKKQIEDYIYNSNQILFDKEFLLNAKPTESSVSNWIKDYIDKYAIDKYDDLFLSEFVTNSQNAKLLDGFEKDKLYTVLKFYLNIKFFPKIFDNVPEDDWNLFPIDIYKEPIKQRKVFTPGPVVAREEIKQVKTSNIDQILASYKKFELEFRQVEEKFTNDLKLKKSTDLDEEFLNFVNSGKKEEATSVLSYVCRNNLISIFFKDNKILQNEFRKYLNSKFDDQIIDNVINSFGTVESVSLFLQFLLNEKIKLPQKDSGILAMYLANIFKKTKQEKYFPIVYGDVNSGMFVFREIKEVAGKLVMK